MCTLTSRLLYQTNMKKGSRKDKIYMKFCRCQLLRIGAAFRLSIGKESHKKWLCARILELTELSELCGGK